MVLGLTLIDITSLFPKWFNIRRGAILVAIVGGWALCPWIIISSAIKFLSFMSGYGMFMAPIAAILLSDYWIVKRRKYDVPALYDPKGIYKYNKFGSNWRAFLTTLVVIIPLLPGLVNSTSGGTIEVGQGLKNLFSINWLYGFFTSTVLYVSLNKIWPDRQTIITEVVPGTLASGDISEDVERHADKEEKKDRTVTDSTEL